MLLALHSCQQQIYPNLEIIIVEHDSTENLSEISRQFASTTKGRVIFTQCQQPGASCAYNHGLALAKGDYIQWLSGSDELTKEKIALQVAALEQNRQFDIAYGDWQWCFYQNEQCQLRIAFAFQQNDDEKMQRLMHNWQPLHAFLIRRSTAVRLQELQVWNYPQTQLDADREYLTLAAMVGFRFLHVQHSTVLHNHFSSSQMILSDSYVGRVERLKQMFLRFQYHATMQPLGEITEQHWFLLKQSWDLWKLAPVTLQQHGEDAFFLQHSQKELGMPLNLVQARIVSALYKSDEACTLEDHARKIVRMFWKQIVQQSGGEGLNVAAELSRWVGLTHPETSDSSPHQLAQASRQSTSLLQASIDAIPLSAPLFVEQQLVVLYVLDKLRTAGMLNQFSEPQSQINQSMPARQIF